MQRLLSELERRSWAAKSHYRAMYRSLVLVRDFAQASQLADMHPTMRFEPLPSITESIEPSFAGPTEWIVRSDINGLIHKAVDLQAPAQIVVIAHPTCGFSRDAMAAIEADPILGPIFATNAKWIAPPAGTLDVERFQHWNREHPGLQMTLAVKHQEWPMIDEWATPTFYFFKSGELKFKLVGWALDDEGNKPAVVEALQQVGLLE